MLPNIPNKFEIKYTEPTPEDLLWQECGNDAVLFGMRASLMHLEGLYASGSSEIFPDQLLADMDSLRYRIQNHEPASSIPNLSQRRDGKLGRSAVA